MFDPRSSKRRRQYRVRRQGERGLEAIVRIAEQTARRAAILDSSAGGVGLAFHPGEEFELEELQMIVLRMSAPDAFGVVETTGIVRHVGEGENKGFYGVEFVAPDELFEQLTGNWWRYFNRRRAFRVPFDLDDAPTVSVVAPGWSGEGRMLDLSVQGLGIRVGAEDAARLEVGGYLRVAFQLSEEDSRMMFVGELAHVTPGGSGARLGVRFEESRSSRFEEKTDTLVVFVMRYQQSLASAGDRD